ncbi:hypothetical protein PIB30_029329 [Stylosanthes scabra]|uniref:Uncharacterized protein n=1 Tax=Stylosanthes scabra TaxID=79078 RepID=A0ABU6QBV1_9FABA|nr:hypothetical protein [Stylosanthes scabra]
MRATAYLHLFARGASSQGVARQTDRVRTVPELPVRIQRSPSRMLKSGSAKEDAAEALPPPDLSTLPSDEQTTLTSPPTVHIPDVLKSTVPRIVPFPLRKNQQMCKATVIRHGRHISRREMWIMESIAGIESRDESAKELSQNDSLAQVLGKEHLGQVCGVGLGPCPTKLFGSTP